MRFLNHFFALALIALFAACASNRERLPSLTDGKVGIQNSVTLREQVSKVDLMSRARLFFAENHLTDNDVIQIDDENSGVIYGRAFVKVSYGLRLSYFKMYYTFRVECGTGSYRYTLRNVYAHGSGLEIPAEKYWSMPMGRKPGHAIGDELRSIAKRFEQTMEQKIPTYTLNGAVKN